ncbi:hypothetical protein MUO56_03955 [Candidatus Bathyarchaeota archaeon]|nr:hypothetical protein [Candidatus Bathyarchaeota archaeon]
MLEETKKDAQGGFRKILFRASKATIKGSIFYGVYFLLSQYMAPIFTVVPSFQQTIESFVIAYTVLLIAGELTGGTVYQHFLNVAKALFVVGYLMLSMKSGVIELTLSSIRIAVDFRLILTAAVLLSLLGVAKAVLQAVDYMSEKAEPPIF